MVAHVSAKGNIQLEGRIFNFEALPLEYMHFHVIHMKSTLKSYALTRIASIQRNNALIAASKTLVKTATFGSNISKMYI